MRPVAHFLLPVPGDLTVLLFGDSTTLGFGPPDNQAVVAMLEVKLAPRHPRRTVRGYNFGRGNSFSAQERALFTSLPAQGLAPDRLKSGDCLHSGAAGGELLAE